MQKLILALCFVLAIGNAFADDLYRISPFDPIYDTLNQKTLRNFELFPQVEDEDIARYNCGTKSDAEVIARDAVMRNALYVKSFWSSKVEKTIGKHVVKLYGPANVSGKNVYFWIVKGQVNHYHKYWGGKATTPPKEGYTHNYTYIFHIENSKPKEIFYIVENELQKSDSSICHALAAFIDTVHEELTTERYNLALQKELWTHKGKESEGKLQAYKNERLVLRSKTDSTRSLKAADLSLDDQDILRGYLDYLQIPVR